MDGRWGMGIIFDGRWLWWSWSYLNQNNYLCLISRCGGEEGVVVWWMLIPFFFPSLFPHSFRIRLKWEGSLLKTNPKLDQHSNPD